MAHTWKPDFIQIYIFICFICFDFDAGIKWNKISLMVIKAGVRTHINRWNKLHLALLSYLISHLYQRNFFDL